MSESDLDWGALDALRERFLDGAVAAAPYWRSRAALASYDRTYGERIGWKWDQVLRELALRGWRPAANVRTLVDWGCGSGIAGRRVAAHFGAGAFDSLEVWDHSALAMEFAEAAARRELPYLRVTRRAPGAAEPIGLLVVSHVLNELDGAGLAALRAQIARADALIWVEPGSREVSRRLSALRDELRDGFRLVAPCTHQRACPMLAAENERHWCHFFAPPPPEIFADSDWMRFGRRAGIDLRSLPYSFVALERPRTDRHADDESLSRIIGRVQSDKVRARVRSCDAGGLAELSVRKRADAALKKELERSDAPLVCRWRREGDEILGGELP